MSESDEKNERKITSRKRLPDLKAVAALIDDQNDEDALAASHKDDKAAIYSPDEELLETTGRIKNQRDLIRSRLFKMETSRAKVSRAVYDKVFRDYTLQLESISQLLTDKKSLLKKELKSLYLLLEKKTLDVSRHREILEEARFRHFLDEFSEDQYKEVEDYESREITQLQADMAELQSFIRLHEELFDPEDLGRQPKVQVIEESLPRPSEVEPTHTMAYAPTPEPAPEVIIEVADVKPPEADDIESQLSEYTPSQPAVDDIFSDQTPPPDESAVASAEIALGLSDPAPQTVSEDQVDVVQEPSDYFADEVQAPELTPPPLSRENIVEEESSKSENTIIRDRQDMEQSDNNLSAIATEPSQTHSQVASITPAVTALEVIAATQTGQAKLVFIESDGPLEAQEYLLTDNVSIGRSPSNDMVLKAPKVSRQHAAINKYKDQYLIIDLKSSNGVFINGRKIDEHELQEGDEVSVGGYKMIFKKG